MAYAVLLRKKGADGSRAADWFGDFQTGDTPTRRSVLAARPPDPANWDVVEVDKAGYDATDSLVYGAARTQASADAAARAAALASGNTKLRSFLALPTTGLTAAELDELMRAFR